MADRDLSQEQVRREAALSGMQRFADEHGVTNREWREEDRGDVIAFIGTTDDGRDFTLAYEKARE